MATGPGRTQRRGDHGFTAKTGLGLVYSEPTIARVGCAWSALDQSHLLTGQTAFGPADSGLPPGQGRGLLRVYVDRRDGRVLGGAMIGPGCEHLAQALAWGAKRGSGPVTPAPASHWKQPSPRP